MATQIISRSVCKKRMSNGRIPCPTAPRANRATGWTIVSWSVFCRSRRIRATHDPKYADHAATELAAYLDKLQQPNGLFFHADMSHHFWGRGNGWFAVALAEVLSSLPPDHPKYARLMAGYKKMMAGLKMYQAPSGLWRQLVDNDKAWDETSCTGMFTYALVIGVQHGWLDASYGAGRAARLDRPVR